jgi:hypothetical protein
MGGEHRAAHRGPGFLQCGGAPPCVADVASSPLPQRLSELVRRLNADRTESSGEERDRKRSPRRHDRANPGAQC